MAFCLIHHFEKAIAYIIPPCIRPAGYNLCRHTVDLLSFGEIRFTDLYLSFGRSKIPVLNKAHLHLIHRIPLKTQMCISPWAIPFFDAQIFIPNVKAADIANLSINHRKLTVIAVIQPHNKPWQKCSGKTASLVERLKKVCWQTSIANTIIQYAYLYTLCRFFCQLLHHLPTQPIPPPDIVFQMDMLFCPAYILNQGTKLVLAIIIIIQFIIKGKPASAVHVQMCKICQIFMFQQQLLIADALLLLSVLANRLHITSVNRPIIFFLFQKHFFPTAVPPEYHIYNKT